MTDPYAALLRVKQLKEEQSVRAVHAMREALVDAERSVAAARLRKDESESGLECRFAAVYQEIIGRDIGMGDVDEVKARILRIEKDHARLVDDCERALHVLARVESDLQKALLAHRDATRNRDKYLILRDEISQAAEAEAAAREEVDIEDLFSVRRRAMS